MNGPMPLPNVARHKLSGAGDFRPGKDPVTKDQDYCQRCGYSLIYILAYGQKCDADRREVVLGIAAAMAGADVGAVVYGYKKDDGTVVITRVERHLAAEPR